MTRQLVAALVGFTVPGWLVAPLPARQQPFAVKVDGVAVDVLVTRDRRPVTGLTAADFRLRDNGVPQRVESVMIEDVPITLFLVLDVSASVKGELLVRLKSAAEAASRALRPQDRIGLLTFSDRVQVVAAPSSDPRTLPLHVRSLEAGGATALYDATFAAVVLRQRIPGRTVVLVFSDGDDTASWLEPRAVFTAAQRSDVVVHAVSRDGGLRRATDADLSNRELERTLFDAEPQLFGRLYLSRLVEETGGSLFVADSSGLQTAFARVVNEFRSRYVLTYSPVGVASGGWHTIDVTVNGPKANVQARRGYLR
jgi:Ca-activated chloride channel family protein